MSPPYHGIVLPSAPRWRWRLESSAFDLGWRWYAHVVLMGEETVRFHSLLLGASPRDRDALVLEFARIFQTLELCSLPHMGSGGS